MRSPPWVTPVVWMDRDELQRLYEKPEPIMTRPIDETWTPENVEVHSEEYDPENRRARLAAQAPAMARLLLKLSEPVCPVCNAHDGDPCNTLDTGHHAFCELGDLLEAAGALE